jgi:hypothetical protein
LSLPSDLLHCCEKKWKSPQSVHIGGAKEKLASLADVSSFLSLSCAKFETPSNREERVGIFVEVVWWAKVLL